jgi:hypothetical protein
LPPSSGHTTRLDGLDQFDQLAQGMKALGFSPTPSRTPSQPSPGLDFDTLARSNMLVRRSSEPPPRKSRTQSIDEKDGTSKKKAGKDKERTEDGKKKKEKKKNNLNEKKKDIDKEKKARETDRGSAVLSGGGVEAKAAPVLHPSSSTGSLLRSLSLYLSSISLSDLYHLESLSISFLSIYIIELYLYSAR